jgi:uncharacterized protein involved in exopolysaccharide biosynthesis
MKRPGWHREGNPPAPDYGPDLRELFLRGVARSPGWVIGAAVAGCLAGFVYGLVTPDTFVSEAGLLLRVGAREQITAESLVGMEQRPQVMSPTMLDEMQMLSDISIYERVVAEVGPQRILVPADPTRDDGPLTSWPVRKLHELQRFGFRWTRPPHDCPSEDCPQCMIVATRVLVRNTKITNEPGSNVIRIAHTSTASDRARLVTQALVDAFIERHREQFSSRALLEKNRDKIDQAKQARDAAANAYIEHVSNSKYIDLDTQLPALEAEIHALENEQFSVSVRREEIARQHELLTEQAQGKSSSFHAASPPLILPNKEYEAQLARKRSLIAQRWNLAFQELEDEELSRRKQELDTQLAQVDQRLSQLPKSLVQSPEPLDEPIAVSPTGEPIEAVLKREDRALVVKEEMLERRLADKRVWLSGIRKQGLSEDLKRRDLAAVRDTKESQYQHLLERFSALEALVNIDMIEDANLQVLNQPTLASESAGPKRVSALLKGLLAGLAVGIFAAMLGQWRDARQRGAGTPQPAGGGVPVLGVVPATHALKDLRKGTAG